MTETLMSRWFPRMRYVKVSLDWAPKEVRFIASVLGLYISFLYWGYLQEKITSTKYTVQMINPEGSVVGTAELKWDYSIALNFCMAVSASFGAAVLERITATYLPSSIWLFWEMAITCSLASPIGYFSLKFIPYPLMVLAKSSKQVPVMLMGLIVFQQSYPWYKYLSVVLICGGVAMYTLFKASSSSGDHHHGSSEDNEYAYIPEKIRLLIGIVLIVTNLLLDGYTNNKQDYVFHKHGVSSLGMMKYLNIWQGFFLLLSLVVPLFFHGIESHKSELENALYMFQHCPDVRRDILLFCICATVGQVLIFVVMQEFGSLVWITVGVTRKLITIIMSIVVFKHKVNLMQWAGIVSVFVGLALESSMSYMMKEKKHKSSGKEESNTAAPAVVVDNPPVQTNGLKKTDSGPDVSTNTTVQSETGPTTTTRKRRATAQQK